MRKILLFIFSLAVLNSLQAQDGHNHADPNHKHTEDTSASIELKEVEYDFGKIPQGKPVYHYFELVNKSNAALKIDNIQTTCGCTTPEWDREPLAAGSSTKIKVGYNAAAEGYFEKFITVQYNGNSTKQIKIKGTVWKAPVGAAPANASVQFLKQQTL